MFKLDISGYQLAAFAFIYMLIALAIVYVGGKGIKAFFEKQPRIGITIVIVLFFIGLLISKVFVDE